MAPCPWSSLTPATSRFCEDALCGIVREPANERFGLVCTFLGVGSAIFHATGSCVGGMLDSAGMQAAARLQVAAAGNQRRKRVPRPSAVSSVMLPP